jgi:uncharacterized membrane protein
MTSAPTTQAPLSDKKKHSIRPSHIVQGGHTPVVMQEAERRAASVQLRVADAITTFAGSMRFVYLHALIFGVWCATGLFGLDKFPFEFLTMAVSLEAIFLSTFVMIAQNRQASFAQAKADHDFISQETELATNTELTKEIHRLTQELHERLLEAEAAIKSGKIVRNPSPSKGTSSP